MQGIDWDYFCYLLDDYPPGDLDDLTDEDSLSPVMVFSSPSSICDSLFVICYY